MTRLCSVPECGLPHHARSLCRKHYLQWRYGVPFDAPLQQVDGPGVCTCPVSYPNPKCCRHCGFPVVHLMEPYICERAIAKMPQLARQIIATGYYMGAAS